MCKLQCCKLKGNISRYRLGVNLPMGFGGIFLRRLGMTTGDVGEKWSSSHLPGFVALIESHGEGKLLDRSCQGEKNPFPKFRGPRKGLKAARPMGCGKMLPAWEG